MTTCTAGCGCSSEHCKAATIDSDDTLWFMQFPYSAAEVKTWPVYTYGRQRYYLNPDCSPEKEAEGVCCCIPTDHVKLLPKDIQPEPYASARKRADFSVTEPSVARDIMSNQWTDKEDSAKADPVKRPSHYTSHPSGVECIDVTEHMGFNLGNAIKYIWRADLKDNALQDLKKAAWYINRQIELVEGTEEDRSKRPKTKTAVGATFPASRKP